MNFSLKPPSVWKQFEDPTFELPPPEIPKDGYSMFGVRYTVPSTFIQPLSVASKPQLYDERCLSGADSSAPTYRDELHR